MFFAIYTAADSIGLKTCWAPITARPARHVAHQIATGADGRVRLFLER